MKYKFAYGIAAGAVSGGRKAKRRDNIRTAFKNGVAVIFLAGSAAGIAAELTAECFDELYASESDYIKKKLSGKKADGALLFVAVKGNRYLAGQMGNGLIASLADGCTVLSGPEPEGTDELRIYRGEVKEPFGFMLMSGGACRSLYEADTENLSPACSTFFEWLKEYDEETVSEALLDNINKYFIKDVKGDIGVGMMVSAEGESEPEVVLETAEPAGGTRGGRALKYLLGALVVVAVIFVFAMKPELPMANSGDTKPSAAVTEEEPKLKTKGEEPAVTFSVENPESYDAGRYKIGVDIPAGEYFFWTGEMLKPYSIVVNDDTCLSGELYCMTVRVNDYDILETEYRFTAAENLNPVKATKGILFSGKYKIGKDIVPGTYTVKPVSRDVPGRYYSVLDEEISNNTKIIEDRLVEVPEEGYIVFYNSVLVVEE